MGDIIELLLYCKIPISGFIISTILYFILFKTINPYKLGIIYGIIHFSYVIYLTGDIYFALAKDGEVFMKFIPIFLLDMPSSLLANVFGLLSRNIFGYKGMAENFYIPAAVFLIFGSLQYFLIGTGIGWVYKKVTKK
jgi:hypothetical protein